MIRGMYVKATPLTILVCNSGALASRNIPLVAPQNFDAVDIHWYKWRIVSQCGGAGLGYRGG